MSKSYWQSMVCDSANSKRAILSWFGFAAEGMMPESADVLCDKATDREKKLRAIMVDADGTRFKFTRTIGRTFTIKRERLPTVGKAPAPEASAERAEGERARPTPSPES